MITEEQAIAIADNFLLTHTGKPLNDLERAVLSILPENVTSPSNLIKPQQSVQ
ncbi:MAG: hypothetical protein AAFY33_19080 [Cyanobacteria bacterium J06643_4]